MFNLVGGGTSRVLFAPYCRRSLLFATCNLPRYYHPSLGVQDREHIQRDLERQKRYSKKTIRKVTNPFGSSEKSSEVINEHFQKLRLSPALVQATKDLGYEVPTPIQKRAIPLLLSGRSLVGSAETGTGKTAAYALPLLQRLSTFLKKEQLSKASTPIIRRSAPLALILCPSRELAEQLMEQIYQYAKHLPNIKIVGLYGALTDRSIQVKELQRGVDVLISTPGRLLTLIKNRKERVPQGNKKSQKKLENFKGIDDFTEEEEVEDSNVRVVNSSEGIIDLSHVKMFVLDEVDRMLYLGHAPEIKGIFLNLPKPNDAVHKLQVVMFTATLMGKAMNLISRFAPNHERIDLNWNLNPSPTVTQKGYYVDSNRKRALLLYLLRRKGSLKNKKVLVFCRTRQRVVNLAEVLKTEGFLAEPLFKSQSLETRQKNIQMFKDNQLKILVSTDVMSRGMDIQDLEVVVNFDVPYLPEEYIHRIGRTGRAGRPGEAITLISKKPFFVTVGKDISEINELALMQNIEKLLEKKVHTSKVPGPWKDAPKSNKKNPLMQRLERQAKEKMERLETKYKKIADHVKRVKKLKKISPQEKECYQVIKKKNRSLRDFKEGRYEDLISKLEKKKVRKTGLVVPDNFEKIASEQEEKKQKLRKEKQAKLIEQAKRAKLKALSKKRKAKTQTPAKAKADTLKKPKKTLTKTLKHTANLKATTSNPKRPPPSP
eukprot:TRINITY_DN2886_c0_g1_i1.p1 TRINITY_DN2886_c0_g1~~TRINITY_DN2886_c0_g1_i1.p1  ORF type:complete len:713 (-),score=196.30 TRINITY_DN2886_c0_g1_i1:77-2215(-)